MPRSERQVRSGEERWWWWSLDPAEGKTDRKLRFVLYSSFPMDTAAGDLMLFRVV